MWLPHSKEDTTLEVRLWALMVADFLGYQMRVQRRLGLKTPLCSCSRYTSCPSSSVSVAVRLQWFADDGAHVIRDKLSFTLRDEKSVLEHHPPHPSLTAMQS